MPLNCLEMRNSFPSYNWIRDTQFSGVEMVPRADEGIEGGFLITEFPEIFYAINTDYLRKNEFV